MKVSIGYIKMVPDGKGGYAQLFTADQTLDFNLSEGEYMSTLFMEADGQRLMTLPMELTGPMYASPLLNLGGKDEETPV